MWVLSLLLGLLVVLLITAATGWFVAQEFAYMAVDRSRLAARAATGDAAAERALAVTRRTSFMLSGAQLGITVTALLVGYVAEPLVGEALGTGLGGVGVPTGVGIAVGTAFALLLSTFVQMLFGELFPKNLAIARPEPVALWLARSTSLYLRLFGWLITVFDQASERLLRAVGMEPVHDVDSSATRHDLTRIVAASRASGDLPAEVSVLLDRLLDFPDRDVAHAMVPRARVDTVPVDLGLDALWTRMAAGHSRYPVLDEAGDVVGVVALTDLLAAPARAGHAVRDVMREPLLLPGPMPLPAAWAELERHDAQLACVLDEHGGFAGVLSVEDLAEELVGEIDDEHDPLPVRPVDLAAGELPGSTPLDEVERSLGRPLPPSDSETLAGLLVETYGALPRVGDHVEVVLPPTAQALLDAAPETRLRLTVLAVERHVPSVVGVLVEDPIPVEDPAPVGDPAPVEEPAPVEGGGR